MAKKDSFTAIDNSGSRTRTYDIMINSHALLPTELCRNETAWRRPTLTKGKPFTTIGAKTLLCSAWLQVYPSRYRHHTIQLVSIAHSKLDRRIKTLPSFLAFSIVVKSSID